MSLKFYLMNNFILASLHLQRNAVESNGSADLKYSFF